MALLVVRCGPGRLNDRRMDQPFASVARNGCMPAFMGQPPEGKAYLPTLFWLYLIPWHFLSVGKSSLLYCTGALGLLISHLVRSVIIGSA